MGLYFTETKGIDYNPTLAEAARLREALAAGLPGSNALAGTLEEELLRSPNRAHDLRT